MYKKFRNSYTISPFIYKNYVDLTTDEAIEVLKCRNDIEVRKWMTSTEEIPLENHLKYIENLKTSENNFYWAVYVENDFLGGVSLVGLENLYASAGLFLNPKLIGTGLGIQIAICSNDLFFRHLGMKSLHSIVKKDNKNAVQLNKFIGYTFLDSDSEFLPIEQTQETWMIKRKKLLKVAFGKNADEPVFVPLS
ncbi:MAG: GNAT family N-acetyltransferase [Bacteroidales bacterium]|nr:GNAT family N-acetyltransferase [Bacteroidales bacterium]